MFTFPCMLLRLFFLLYEHLINPAITNIQKQPPEDFSTFLKLCKIHRRTSVPEPRF